MKKYHLLTLFLVLSVTVQAQKLFYTTYQDSKSYLHVKDLASGVTNINLASFVNDSIRQIVVNNEEIYLTGKDSLYIIIFNPLEDLVLQSKKAFYVKDIKKIYVSDSLVIGSRLINDFYDLYFVESRTSLLESEDKNYFNGSGTFLGVGDIYYNFVFLSSYTFYSLAFWPSGQKNEDTHIFSKHKTEERTFPTGFQTYSSIIHGWDIYQLSKSMYSFAIKNDSNYYSIVGKDRYYNRPLEEVTIQKFVNTNSLYSTSLPKNIGAFVPNFNFGIENNVLYSLSESNVLYKITDNEALQEFEIDSLATFSTPILSLMSSNDDRLFMLKKDTIFDLNSEIIVQKNISAFTLQDKSVITSLKKTKDINEIVTFSIYPNPNEGIFYLDVPFNENEIKKIQVYDNVGNLILETNPSDQNEINMTNTKKGIYFVTLVLNTKVLTQKIILN